MTYLGRYDLTDDLVAEREKSKVLQEEMEATLHDIQNMWTHPRPPHTPSPARPTLLAIDIDMSTSLVRSLSDVFQLWRVSIMTSVNIVLLLQSEVSMRAMIIY